jgi:CBS domain-containing protein
MKTVRDIMQADVIRVTPDTTGRELARILQDAGVSGVPVCDTTGRVLGVVSATDLVRLAAESAAETEAWEIEEEEDVVEDDENESAAWSYYLTAEPPPRFIETVSAGGPDLDGLTVRDFMTPTVHAVPPDATLPELARLLLDRQIHRALVLDGDRLAGIVTTLDVLRAVADS